MLNLDLLGNGDGRPSPVKQDAIHRALEGLGEPKKLFIQLCLQDDPGRRPKALSLLKHHVLQEVGGLEWLYRGEGGGKDNQHLLAEVVWGGGWFAPLIITSFFMLLHCDSCSTVAMFM